MPLLQSNQSVSNARRWLGYAVLTVLVIGGLVMAYKSFFWQPKQTGVYSAAAPAKGMASAPTHTTAPVKLRAYDKATVTRKMDLPAGQIAEPKEVTATATLPPSEGGYTAAAITDTQTGETVIVTKEEPAPLFGFGGKTEVGALAGITTKGEAAGVYVRQDVLRIGRVNVGVAGAAGMSGGSLAAGAFATVGVRW